MTAGAMSLDADLAALLGRPDLVSAGSSILALHAHDGSLAPPTTPEVVVFPETTQHVAQVMAYANEHVIPVTPYAAGTSSSGKTVPLKGGISLDMTRMDRIVAVHDRDFDVVVGPGVLRKALNVALAEHGLFFPVDPGADASLGGMASTNASGTTTVRYGGMRANILALEVVLADGSIVRTGTRARKTTAGYDMTDLFVGAEGTLGVITELTLRAHAIPERIVSARVSFPDLVAAANAVVSVVSLSTILSRIEMLDGPTLEIVNAHFGTDLNPGPTLFIEVGGSERGVDEEIELIGELCRAAGGLELAVERDPTAQHRLWDARHNFGHALAARFPGRTTIGTDVCVPISVLPDAVANARRHIDAHGLHACLVAHAGDGNFHFVFMVDPATDEPARVQEIYGAMVDHALAHGGTCSAEHGIGVEKQGFLQREHGDLVPAMWAVKRALDPKGIINPGKILPEP